MHIKKILIALVISVSATAGVAEATPASAEQALTTEQLQPSIADQLQQITASGIKVSPNVQVSQVFSAAATKPTFQYAFDTAVQSAVASAAQAGYQSSQCTVTKYVSYPNPDLSGSHIVSYSVTVYISCTKQM